MMNLRQIRITPVVRRETHSFPDPITRKMKTQHLAMNVAQLDEDTFKTIALPNAPRRPPREVMSTM